MAAALRTFRCRPDASSARLLPLWLPGPSPKLYDAAASSLRHTRGLHSSPNPVPSLLRRHWSARSRGGDAAAGLASARRRACLSPPQVPSLLPVRNHGSTSTKQLNSLERIETMEAIKSAIGKLQDAHKSVARRKRDLWVQIGLLGVLTYSFFQRVYLLMLEVAILKLRVEELEKP